MDLLMNLLFFLSTSLAPLSTLSLSLSLTLSVTHTHSDTLTYDVKEHSNWVIVWVNPKREKVD